MVYTLSRRLDGRGLCLIGIFTQESDAVLSIRLSLQVGDDNPIWVDKRRWKFGRSIEFQDHLNTTWVVSPVELFDNPKGFDMFLKG